MSYCGVKDSLCKPFNLINSKGGHSSADKIFQASLQRKNLSVNLEILL